MIATACWVALAMPWLIQPAISSRLVAPTNVKGDVLGDNPRTADGRHLAGREHALVLADNRRHFIRREAPGMEARRIVKIGRVDEAVAGELVAHPGVTGENVTGMIVKGMISRHVGGTLMLTDRGRAVLRALLPHL